MPEPEKDRGIEMQQQPSLERSSSSSASSYKTAYAQSFVSTLSTDDITLPGGAGLGSARPSGNTGISLAAITHTKSGNLSETAVYREALHQSAASRASQRASQAPDRQQHGDGTDVPSVGITDAASMPADSMQSSIEDDRSTAYRHLNGSGPHTDSKGSDEGEHTSGVYLIDLRDFGPCLGGGFAITQ